MGVWIVKPPSEEKLLFMPKPGWNPSHSCWKEQAEAIKDCINSFLFLKYLLRKPCSCPGEQELSCNRSQRPPAPASLWAGGPWVLQGTWPLSQTARKYLEFSIIPVCLWERVHVCTTCNAESYKSCSSTCSVICSAQRLHSSAGAALCLSTEQQCSLRSHLNTDWQCTSAPTGAIFQYKLTLVLK